MLLVRSPEIKIMETRHKSVIMLTPLHMKDNIRIIYHPNQEIKTGKPMFASFTCGNFSSNESLPGKKAFMEIVRDKEPVLERIAKATRLFFRKYWFTRL